MKVMAMVTFNSNDSLIFLGLSRKSKFNSKKRKSKYAKVKFAEKHGSPQWRNTLSADNVALEILNSPDSNHIVDFRQMHMVNLSMRRDLR